MSRVAGMSAPFVIRPAGRDDLDVIAAIQEAAIMRFGVRAYGQEGARIWARIGYEVRHDLLDQGTFFVAEWPGRVIGVGGWSPDGVDPALAWIRYLFVHPDAARQGTGRALLAVTERSALAAGRLRFEVWSSLNAVGFYQAQGYRRLRPGRWPLGGRTELDYVLMDKRPRPAQSG